MKAKIEKTLKTYLRAIYQQDLETVYDLLYLDDIIEYKSLIEEFAEKMDPFGETEDFLKKLGLKNLSSLKKMTPKELMYSIFNMITNEVGEKEMKKMIKGTKILEIDQADVLTNVKYEMPVKMWDEMTIIQTEVNMIKTGGKWKVLFKSGMRHGLKRFQQDIDDYHERKAQDQIPKDVDEIHLTPYTIIGYKDENGNTVLEARFKEAGEFSEGLAAVQILTKYGFINKRGELVIKPQFHKAQAFCGGLAAVLIRSSEQFGRGKWGFINKKGKLVIPAVYEDIGFFMEGLCNVEKDSMWGYINKKGKTVIPFKFEETEPFHEGEANVSVRNSKGVLVDMTIDKKGRLVD